MTRGRRGLSVGTLLLACFLNGCASSNSSTPPPSGGPPPTLTLTPVVSGLSSPIDFEAPNDGTGRFFVAEQAGITRIAMNGTLLPTPFLDISSKVDFSGEKGFLGLAFHPQFPQKNLFYVHYDRLVGSLQQSVIAEYEVSTSDPNQASPTERILLTVDQPTTANHKGGQIAFGPDGFLYIGLGDGGGGGDPLGNGQNLQTLLAKVLRIDVDHKDAGLEYAIPPTNPLAAGGGRPEIFAYGFRNPFGFSFERGTGRLFLGDVGQNKYEEIDIVQGGDNYGWNVMEGMHCFSPATGCNMSGLILPIAEYDHTEGNAIIGGYVYKGSAIPSLTGAYLFSDNGSGTIWKLVEGPTGTWTRTTLLASNRGISSLGQDVAGEIYFVDYGGSVLKLTAQ
jgi:glucose/arabinose dehydrogenase